MAESTLTLTYSDLKASVGRFLGYGRTSGAWTTEQAAEIEAAVQKGYRRFLTPDPIAPGDAPHVWSFLCITATLTTVADQSENDLPDNYAYYDSPYIPYAPTTAYPAVKVIGEGQLLQKRAAGDITGRPLFAAVRPKSGTEDDSDEGQRFEVMWFPTPDSAYSLYWPIFILPDKLTASAPYPLGGSKHSDTIEELCLAAAEELEDDGPGIHSQRAAERLRASVLLDRAQTGTQNLGYGLRTGEVDPNLARYATYEGDIPTS